MEWQGITVDIVHDFDSEIDLLLQECEKRIHSYPSIMQEDAVSCLARFHLLRNDEMRTGGFAYLMPFWLEQEFGLDVEACRTAALGNVFGLLYFLTQDAVMDSDGERDLGHILPLSSMFFLDFISMYRKLFEPDSPFWTYFHEYISQWAESVLWERREHHRRLTPYSESGIVLLARKAAPLKIPFAALSMLAGRHGDIEAFSNMIDYDQAVYQMIDDWRDWKKDLEEGNYSYFLTEAASYCGIKDPDQLDETHVRKAIYIGDVAEKIFDQAVKLNTLSIQSIGDMECRYLRAYLEFEGEVCRQVSDGIAAEKQRVLRGGFGRLFAGLG